MQIATVPRKEERPGFVGTPLSVVFAEGDAIDAVRRVGSGTLTLSPPYHLSDADRYLVVPDDIGMELCDILRDGDIELLQEAMRDGLLVIGEIARRGRGKVALEVACAASPRAVLAPSVAYAATVTVGGADDPVRTANRLPHARVTLLSALVDDEGLDAMLRGEQYVGVSWRLPGDAPPDLAVDPTLAWSRRLPDGTVGVELALFQEDDELTVLVRPVLFRA
jgi:hypothetical protein